MVVFHPGIVSLSAGAGAERRRLLDRVALYLGPGSLAEAEGYGQARCEPGSACSRARGRPRRTSTTGRS